MELWIDSANVDEMRTVKSWGFVSGVTTNTTKIAQQKRSFRELLDEICTIMKDYPVSVMAVQHQYASEEVMIRDGRELVDLHPNIVVKLPPTFEGFKAARVLGKGGIRTNITLVFSVPQALLAAKAGATYVSPFIGRLDDVGENGLNLLRDIKTAYANYGFSTKILAAALRTPLHVAQSAIIGADIATAAFDVLKILPNHPLTNVGLTSFLEDWKGVRG